MIVYTVKTGPRSLSQDRPEALSSNLPAAHFRICGDRHDEEANIQEKVGASDDPWRRLQVRANIRVHCRMKNSFTSVGMFLQASGSQAEQGRHRGRPAPFAGGRREGKER